jgi:hypothetical protein
VDERVRRLALTLTAPEFSDLEARRARLVARLAALELRLAGADETELRDITRALAAPAMADVSFRALRSDLERAESALAEAVRALAAGHKGTQ